MNLKIQKTLVIISGIVLFFYFGIMIIPQWFHVMSIELLLWFCASLVVIPFLLAAAKKGRLGLESAKANNALPDIVHIYLYRLAQLSVIWLIISAGLGAVTHRAYVWKEFDPELWNEVGSWNENGYKLSPRKRMINDLTKNILPDNSKSELEIILGEPDRSWISEDRESYLYDIGSGQLSIDPECLVVVFDSEGNFLDFYITYSG